MKHKRAWRWGPGSVVILVLLALWMTTAHAYYICIQPDGTQIFTDSPGADCVKQETPASPGLRSREKPEESMEKRNLLVHDDSADSTDELDQLGIPNNQSEFIDRVRQGDAKTVRLFLASGMSPDVRDSTDMQRPVMVWASAFGHTEVLVALLDHGGAIDAGNTRGVTALMAGAMEGQAAAVRLLLERGADVNAKEATGKTSLMFAAAGGRPTATNIVDLLLENNALINTANDDGGTALIVAAVNGYGSVVRSLISHGADLNLKDKMGKSALMWAISLGNQSSMDALKRAGARE